MRRYDLLGCSVSTTGSKIMTLIEARLVKQSKAVMQPEEEKHQVFFIDDIHMSRKDHWGDQSANELLRQHFDFGGWYNLEKIFFKKIKEINFVATISTRQNDKEIIDERLGWHFGAIGCVTQEGCHIEQIFKYILSKSFIHSNSSSLQQAAPTMIMKASLDFYQTYQRMLKPSPSSFLFKCNTRHLIYLLKGILDAPNNYF